MEKRVPWEQSLAWCLPRHTVTFLPSRMKVKTKISPYFSRQEKKNRGPGGEAKEPVERKVEARGTRKKSRG